MLLSRDCYWVKWVNEWMRSKFSLLCLVWSAIIAIGCNALHWLLATAQLVILGLFCASYFTTVIFFFLLFLLLLSFRSIINRWNQHLHSILFLFYVVLSCFVEIIAFSESSQKFNDINSQVLAISTDSHVTSCLCALFTHWLIHSFP